MAQCLLCQSFFRRGTSVADHILVDGQGKVFIILEHGTKGSPQLLQVIFRQRLAVIENLATGRVVKPQQQLDQRGFTGAVNAHHRQGLALPQGKVHIVEHPSIGARVGKVHMAKFQRLQRRHRQRTGYHLGLIVQKLPQILKIQRHQGHFVKALGGVQGRLPHRVNAGGHHAKAGHGQPAALHKAVAGKGISAQHRQQLTKQAADYAVQKQPHAVVPQNAHIGLGGRLHTPNHHGKNIGGAHILGVLSQVHRALHIGLHSFVGGHGHIPPIDALALIHLYGEHKEHRHQKQQIQRVHRRHGGHHAHQRHHIRHKGRKIKADQVKKAIGGHHGCPLIFVVEFRVLITGHIHRQRLFKDPVVQQLQHPLGRALLHAHTLPLGHLHHQRQKGKRRQLPHISAKVAAAGDHIQQDL